MSKKIILALIVNFFLAISIYSLINLVTVHSSEIDVTSKLRFTYFIGLHSMLFISVFVMVRLSDIYSFVLLAFVNSLIASLGLIICEYEVSGIQKSPAYNYRRFTGKTQKLELTFLNVYFLVYMYAIIGLIISAVFLLATEAMICWQEYIINSKISECLTKREYNQSVKGKDCSICLQEFHEDDKYFIEINVCSHLFHEKCLIQWIRRSKTCPLDRKDIFQYGIAQVQPEAVQGFGEQV